MKKFIAILLIPLFLYNTVGYYIVFKILHSSVEQKVEETIKNNLGIHDLIKISVKDSKKIQWTKAGKEFSYNGNMYDVIEKESKNGLLTFYCIQDFEDSELFNNFHEIISSQFSNSKEQKKKADAMMQLIIKLLFLNETDFRSYSFVHRNVFSIHDFLVLIRGYIPEIPPPKINLL